MYVCETTMKTKGDKRKLLIFIKKILNNVYRLILNPNSGIYERKKNKEIKNIFNRYNIQNRLKAKIPKWSYMANKE